MKRIIKIIFIVSILLLVTSCTCNVESDWYFDEFHLKQIKKRIEKRYILSDYGYESFEIYPLYDENDEFSLYLIEFEPQGYFYVKIYKSVNVFWACAGITGMYQKSTIFRTESDWQRYRVEEYSESYQYGKDNFFEKDEEGNDIYYRSSPYKVADVIGEKLYILNIEQCGCKSNIPAVKRGDKYLNLVSMELFNYEPYSEFRKYATDSFGFYPKHAFL